MIYIKAKYILGAGVASDASTPNVEKDQTNLGLFKLI